MAQSVEELQDHHAEQTVVTLSDQARQVVLEALGQEPDPTSLALWLEVRGVQAETFSYDLYFQARRDAVQGDAVATDDELTVVVPAASVGRLLGARLEWSDDGEGGLVLVNPNRPNPPQTTAGVPPQVLAVGLDNEVAQQIVSVLAEVINPSIAAHGGRSDLVAFDPAEGVAYLKLSGGCQGCAMSRMTLSQGIEVALREEVPQVLQVIDVTDHAGGENPYF